MRKFITILLLGALVSLFFYPVGFSFLPGGLNSKMILAVTGVGLFVLEGIRNREWLFPKKLLFAGLISVLFSLACFAAEVVNGTDDGSYTTYFATFAVWTFSAYTVCFFLRRHYEEIDIQLITEFLVWVAVFQCVSAQLIDRIPAFKVFVDSIFRQDIEFLEDVDRLYGIGAYLDPAGVRFCITLILLAYRIVEKGKTRETFKGIIWDYVAFVVIVVFGNMISRTTTVGAALALGYIFLYSLTHLRMNVARTQLWSVGLVALILLIAVPIFSFLYNTDAAIHESMRFGFEGFFNWAETGEWSTDSTDKLDREMWIWPNNFRTWMIGTGLFGNWAFGTDIGYCRFTLYCGLIGFGVFCLYFVYNALSLTREFEGTGILALLLLALTFVVWIKVSTDIYQIYAFFYCAHSWFEDRQ